MQNFNVRFLVYIKNSLCFVLCPYLVFTSDKVLKMLGGMPKGSSLHTGVKPEKWLC